MQKRCAYYILRIVRKLKMRREVEALRRLGPSSALCKDAGEYCITEASRRRKLEPQTKITQDNKVYTAVTHTLPVRTLNKTKQKKNET